MRIQLEPVRGMRDIVYPESEIIDLLIDEFKRIVRSYGFRRVYTPTIERFELFALKSGEEIKRSMYVFKDKAGREVALRPEVTASIARMYLHLMRAWPKPVKVYYIANCFRYEEPQYARFREFMQAGVEVLGESSLLVDAELVQMVDDFYTSIGLKDRGIIEIGNVAVLRKMLASIGVPEEEQDHVMHLIDKGLVSDALNEVKKYDKAGNVSNAIEFLSKTQDIEKCIEYLRDAGQSEAGDELRKLLELKDLIGRCGCSIVLKPLFARGLAYYTGIIFEVKVVGFPVSVAGGGRYDNLIKLYGGEDLPATGFAIGVDRTAIAIMDLGLQSSLLPKSVSVLVVKIGNVEPSKVLAVARSLRMSGIETSVLYKGVSARKALSTAIERGYRYLVIVGEKEIQRNVVSVRDLVQRRQYEVPMDEVSDVVLKMIKDNSA